MRDPKQFIEDEHFHLTTDLNSSQLNDVQSAMEDYADEVGKIHTLDVNENIVTVGSVIQLPYIDPNGEITWEYDGQTKYSVILSHGALGIETETEFIPLVKFFQRRKGEYVPNCGNKVILENLGIFKIVD